MRRPRARLKKAPGGLWTTRTLEGEGKSEEMKGNLKQAGEKVKDAFQKYSVSPGPCDGQLSVRAVATRSVLLPVMLQARRLAPLS